METSIERWMRLVPRRGDPLRKLVENPSRHRDFVVGESGDHPAHAMFHRADLRAIGMFPLHRKGETSTAAIGRIGPAS